MKRFFALFCLFLFFGSVFAAKTNVIGSAGETGDYTKDFVPPSTFFPNLSWWLWMGLCVGIIIVLVIAIRLIGLFQPVYAK